MLGFVVNQPKHTPRPWDWISRNIWGALTIQIHVGCTPLHWAAIRGHLEACNILVHAGTKQELAVKDKAGFTPIQIASDKGHRHVALSLVGNFVSAWDFHPVQAFLMCIGFVVY